MHRREGSTCGKGRSLRCGYGSLRSEICPSSSFLIAVPEPETRSSLSRDDQAASSRSPHSLGRLLRGRLDLVLRRAA